MERKIRSDIPTVKCRTPEEVTRQKLPLQKVQLMIPQFANNSRLHALWSGFLIRGLLAIPTFCPRTGWDFLQKAHKTTKDLEEMGRYTGEIVTKLLKEGE